ncbi:cobalt ECF transporter T component CbiQ [bacterium]|nr:MAG: cobalt ECF transporter T component CbiQ [bacterium]
MHLEEFAEGHSLWHRMDPRVKILGVISLAVVTAVSDRMSALLFALALALCALVIAHLDIRQVLVRMGVINGFILFLWFFLPFTTQGDIIAQLGGLDIHRQGVILALSITIKANAIAGITIALLGTSTIFDLVHGLVHLRVPQRVVQLFFFTYRYISVIHREYLSLRSSMRIRCFHPGTNFHTYRSFAYLVGMLFVRSLDRSERIYQAMVLRGFSGTFWTLDHFHMRRSDWTALVMMILFVAVQIGLQVSGGLL